MATKTYMSLMPDGSFPEDYMPEVPADQLAETGAIVTVALSFRHHMDIAPKIGENRIIVSPRSNHAIEVIIQ